MNSVSILLYLSSILESVTAFLWVIGIFSLIAGLFLVAVVVFNDLEDLNDRGKKIVRKRYFFIPVGLLFCLIAILIPPKEIVLAMSVSEFTEDFLSSSASDELKGLAGDTLKLLRKTINEQVNTNDD